MSSSESEYEQSVESDIYEEFISAVLSAGYVPRFNTNSVDDWDLVYDGVHKLVLEYFKVKPSSSSSSESAETKTKK